MTDQLNPAILLFGYPGVGKGTQGKLLGDLVGFHHLSSGDIFRALDPDSEQGKQVAGFVSKGELVPDDLTIQICRNRIEQLIASTEYKPSEELLLLDGLPRNVAQCEHLDAFIQVQKVIYLATENDAVLVERIKQRALTEGRADDADEDIIRRRFDVYRSETAPVLNYYPAEKLVSVDPIGTPAEVLKRILEHIIPPLKGQ